MSWPHESRKKLALVIGSGSVKCAAALGVWKVLNEEKIDIDMYVGCSGGSLFASLMALGCEVDESIQHVLQLWNKSVTKNRDWMSILRAIMPGVFGFNERFGMISDNKLLERLKHVYGDRTFADTIKPLRIVATDFHNAEQVVIADGQLVDAIRASICIPYIWKPWPLGGRLLIDGAFSNPMPVDVAIKERMDIILAIGFESPFPKSIKSVSRFAFHISSVLTNNLFRANFAFHSIAHHSEIVLILPEFDRPINLFSTDQIPYVIEKGEEVIKEQIPYIRRLLQNVQQ